MDVSTYVLIAAVIMFALTVALYAYSCTNNAEARKYLDACLKAEASNEALKQANRSLDNTLDDKRDLLDRQHKNNVSRDRIIQERSAQLDYACTQLHALFANLEARGRVHSSTARYHRLKQAELTKQEAEMLERLGHLEILEVKMADMHDNIVNGLEKEVMNVQSPIKIIPLTDADLLEQMQGKKKPYSIEAEIKV